MSLSGQHRMTTLSSYRLPVEETGTVKARHFEAVVLTSQGAMETGLKVRTTLYMPIKLPCSTKYSDKPQSQQHRLGSTICPLPSVPNFTVRGPFAFDSKR